MEPNKIKKILKLFFDNKTNKFLFIGFLILTILFFTLIKKAFIIIIFIFISWIIKFYQKYTDIYLGIDFVMISTILTSIVYGSLIGAIIGIISMLVSSMWRGKFNFLTLISYILLTMIAYITPLLSSLSITTIGITLTITYDLLFLMLSFAYLHGRISRGLTFVISHLMFNAWLFIFIAPKLLKIM